MRLVTALLLAVLAVAPDHTHAASFDCGVARTPVERAICSNPSLGALDSQLADLYRAVREAERDSQRAWLRQRNECGGDVACLTRQYNERIAQLRALTVPAPPESQVARAPAAQASSSQAAASTQHTPPQIAEREREREEERRQQVRQQAAQNARAMRDQYAQRPKTLLEQILNYTTHSNENGIIGDELSEFWISGHQGDHKCILTFVRIEPTGLISLFEAIANITEQGAATPRQIDIRKLNERGFTFRMEFTNNFQSYFSIGDEKQRIFNRQRQQPVEERLHRAWRLAFQECPGIRIAF